MIVLKYFTTFYVLWDNFILKIAILLIKLVALPKVYQLTNEHLYIPLSNKVVTHEIYLTSLPLAPVSPVSGTFAIICCAQAKWYNRDTLKRKLILVN